VRLPTKGLLCSTEKGPRSLRTPDGPLIRRLCPVPFGRSRSWSLPNSHAPAHPARILSPFTPARDPIHTLAAPLRSAQLVGTRPRLPSHARPRARRRPLAAASHPAALTRGPLGGGASGVHFVRSGKGSAAMGKQQEGKRRRGEKDGKRKGRGKTAAAAVPEDAAPVAGCWIRFPRLRGCMPSRAKVDSSTSARGGGRGKDCCRIC
jgi:hypothetical protein